MGGLGPDYGWITRGEGIGLTVIKKVETFAYDGKFRRTRGDGGGGGCLSPLPEEIFFAYFYAILRLSARCKSQGRTLSLQGRTLTLLQIQRIAKMQKRGREK